MKDFAGHQNASQVMWLEFLVEGLKMLDFFEVSIKQSWI